MAISPCILQFLHFIYQIQNPDDKSLYSVSSFITIFMTV